MINLKLLILSALIVLICGPVNALEHKVDFEDLILVAEKNNPQLSSAYSKWKSALELSGVAGALPDPSVSAGFFVRSIETRTGPQKAAFGVTQVLPWFGKLSLKKKKALYRAQVQWQKYQVEKLKLRFRLMKTLAELDFTKQKRVLQLQLRELLNKSEESIESGFINHTVPYSKTLLIKSEQDRVDELIRDTDDRIRILFAEINSLMNRASDTPVPSVNMAAPLTLADSSGFIKKGISGNPGVLKFNALINAEKAGVKLAEKRVWPDPGIGVNYILNSRSVMDVPDNGKDPVRVSVSFKLPLNRKRIKAGIYAATRSAEAVAREKEAFVNKLAVDIERAVVDTNGSYRNIKLYKDSIIPRSLRLMEVTLKEWENGKGTIDTYLDACRMWLEFQLNYYRYLKNNRVSSARLEMLTGKESDR